MDILNSLWKIDYILIEVWGYPLSLIELIGTLSGILSVYLATRANLLTWPTGIINEWTFFLLLYQVRLYSDMLLQIYFFAVSLYGWIYWKKGDKDERHAISWLSSEWRWYYGGFLLMGTIILGFTMSDIHLLFPGIFPNPTDYPFPDAFTTVGSILATVLLARKKMETWILWIIVDVVSIQLYFWKNIWFISAEYLLFLGLATFGLVSWLKKYKHG